MDVYNMDALPADEESARRLGLEKVLSTTFLISEDTLPGAGLFAFASTRFPRNLREPLSRVLHKHDVDEVIFVLSGSGLAVSEQSVQEVKARDFIRMPTREWHGFVNASDSEPVEILAAFGGGVSTFAAAGYSSCPADEELNILARMGLR